MAGVMDVYWGGSGGWGEGLVDSPIPDTHLDCQSQPV